MKQRYSQLVLLILLIFSMTPAVPSLQDQADFDFIMQSLKNSAYYYALNGKPEDGRRGVKDFDKGDSIFKKADTEGNTLLHAAVEGLLDKQIHNGSTGPVETTQIKVIDTIVEKDNNTLDNENSAEMTPCDYAIKKKRYLAAAHLLAYYELDEEILQEAHDLLKVAIENNLIEVTKCLIEKCGISVDSTIQYHNGETDTVLDFAVSIGAKEIVKYLINDKGAQLTATGLTTLHRAMGGDVELAKVVLASNKALLNVENSSDNGKTPLQIAVRQRGGLNINLVKYLIEQGAELYPTLLHDVIKYCNDCASLIEEILNHKQTLLNTQDQTGYTPLIEAINKPSIEKDINYLLTKDALDLTRVDTQHGGNALIWAINKRRFLDVIKRILDKDPSLLNTLSWKGKKAQTPLHQAIGKNWQDLIDELLKRRPNLFIKDGMGRTPFQYAVSLQNKDAVKKMLDIVESSNDEFKRKFKVDVLDTLVKTSGADSILSLEKSIIARLLKLGANPSEYATVESDIHKAVEKGATVSSDTLSAEKSTPIDGQSVTTATGSEADQSRRVKVLATTLIGVSLAIGIGYKIKKMITSNNKPIEDREEKVYGDQEEGYAH